METPRDPLKFVKIVPVNPRKLYLDLIKRSLNNFLYLGGTESFEYYRSLAPHRYKKFQWLLPELSIPLTLLSKEQLDRLEKIILSCIRSKVTGDLIEAGAWQGGATILMKAVLMAYGITDRTVWVADSFAGIPYSKKTVGDPVDNWEDRWVAPLDSVKANFERYGLLDHGVQFIKGTFSKSLKSAPLKQLAIVRIDADSYESTLDALKILYPKIPAGGYVYIDDWHLPACREAVMDYRKSKNIVEKMDESIDAMWRVENSLHG